MAQVAREGRYHLDILEINEMRWLGMGRRPGDEHRTIVYSAREDGKHKRV